MPNNGFAAVQLTLLSVIVALILENLLNQLGASDAQWNSALPWVQSALIAITVITIWSGFALILTVSTRRPEAVDFIYPFGLLIALTLAAGAINPDSLAYFFGYLALAGVFASTALRAELRDLTQKKRGTVGVKQALYIQLGDSTLCALMAVITYTFQPPQAVALFALCISIALQGAAALGTMSGWRFVTDEMLKSQDS